MPGREDQINLCKALLVPCLLLLLALLNIPSELESPATHVINLHSMQEQKTPYYKAVAIGFNTCVDLIVVRTLPLNPEMTLKRAPDVLAALGVNKIKENANLLDHLNTLEAFTEVHPRLGHNNHCRPFLMASRMAVRSRDLLKMTICATELSKPLKMLTVCQRNILN